MIFTVIPLEEEATQFINPEVLVNACKLYEETGNLMLPHANIFYSMARIVGGEEKVALDNQSTKVFHQRANDGDDEHKGKKAKHI